MEAERARAGRWGDAPQPRASAGDPPARTAALGRLVLLIRLAAVAFAAFAWSTVAIGSLDMLGAFDGPAGTAVAAPRSASDPCALREPLPTGNDAKCTFDLGRGEERPLVVDLEQQWNGNVLTQWLSVREPGAVEPLHFVFAKSAAVPQPSRILRLFAVRSERGEDHLVYVTGLCGGTVCGAADMTVVGPAAGRMRTLLSFRLGRLADVEPRERALIALESTFPPGAQRPEAIVARTFVWDGTAYSMRAVAKLDPPSPTPTPR